MTNSNIYQAAINELGNKIKHELNEMKNTLAEHGNCSTIDPARIHSLRTDIYYYTQKATGNTNPASIERTEFAMKLQTIENKLILGCYENTSKLKAEINRMTDKILQ